MKQEQQTLLIHAGCILLIALCAWLATLIHGTDETALALRAALVGSACGLWGKLGFKPANPVLNKILEKLAQREPERVLQALTNRPPPQAMLGVLQPSQHTVTFSVDEDEGALAHARELEAARAPDGSPIAPVTPIRPGEPKP